ncbi:nitroreductase family deazaflavin-dependent oxidoreductase [Actinoplanes sp. TRM 88003]|uniref:Nitroreductase family deazaflavin-dependent oxidoreductase n=1 Tax=Paractinoplanes aksuensis TaxID=2939490 RepID=A0ABT1DIZ6_9ACTN|nr:nitroreductase/quinone reductase family protein [Actinoplanes aksuensis]MCO8270066.1 nitroreductase family deazaflavin-dependent oxidoreductase [Actinoplanes aksuensis]
MAFETRRGTRGARQPGGRLMAWANRLIMRRIRRGQGVGADTLVLTTIGRKSGAERQNPVNYFPGDRGADSWLIVASAAGAAGNPAWYYNLAAHPDQVRIEIGGRAIPVTAEQLTTPDREPAWRSIAAASARFAQYQTKTDRELPVIRLTVR